MTSKRLEQYRELSLAAKNLTINEFTAPIVSAWPDTILDLLARLEIAEKALHKIREEHTFAKFYYDDTGTIAQEALAKINSEDEVK